jgi:nitroreductase
METFEAIMTRRSIRKYTSEEVSEIDVKKILEAAMAAPSARNTQPWHFVVVKDKNVLGKIAEMNPHASMAKEAALAIIVCGDTNITPTFWSQDCCIAAENILIAVHALDLGAVWTAVYPDDNRVKGVRELLKLPENIMPLCLIPIGHPNEKKPAENRYNKERVHTNLW